MLMLGLDAYAPMTIKHLYPSEKRWPPDIKKKTCKAIGEVILPTMNVTCVGFVEAELFITTAEDGDGDARSRELGGACS